MSRDQFMDDVKKNVCGKYRRELAAGSMEVFPLGDFGAMIAGTHVFCKTGIKPVRLLISQKKAT